MTASRPAWLLAFVLSLLASACNHHENPVLPTDPGGGSGVEVLTVTVTADVNQLIAGSPAATPLHISAQHSDGTPPKDGTEVAVNTNIGSFGADAAGKPTLLAKRTLVGGKANVDFFAGSDVGVANILAQVGTNVGRLNVPIIAAPPAPAANFTFAASGLRVLFTDASTGTIASWRWQFGDTTADSTETSPSHTYAAPGTYVVTLTVTNLGGQSSKSQFVTVSLGTGPTAAFEFTVVGNQANFVDKSTGGPTSWSWTFGDSGSSTQQNPIHVYGGPGAYTVSLTVRNAAGENSTSQVVTIAPASAPKADFDFSAAALQVNFIDKSTGAPTSWSWVFGDGGMSTEQNPIHNYGAAGNYTVSLTVRNAGGQDIASKVVAVTAGTAPVAKFAFTASGKQVNFVDQSTGDPTSWSWDFGDSDGSTQRNPIHTYAAAGNYTVTLTVSNAGGSNSTSQVVPIAAGNPPVAAFTFTVNGFKVNFLDRSTGTPTSWLWDFGDGSPADGSQNPVHTYVTAGSYTVVLMATNSAGSNSKSDVVTVPSPPVANFDFTNSGLQVTFSDRSTAAPTSWSWAFGDGGLSTLQNPMHTYAAAGAYSVKLTATNSGGSSSATKTVSVP
jgi:PKD repeat protein